MFCWPQTSCRKRGVISRMMIVRVNRRQLRSTSSDHRVGPNSGIVFTSIHGLVRAPSIMKLRTYHPRSTASGGAELPLLRGAIDGANGGLTLCVSRECSIQILVLVLTANHYSREALEHCRSVVALTGYRHL